MYPFPGAKDVSPLYAQCFPNLPCSLNPVHTNRVATHLGFSRMELVYQGQPRVVSINTSSSSPKCPSLGD